MDDFVKETLIMELQSMLANSSGESGVESLHNLRIAALRMRLALKLFRKSIQDKNLPKLRNELRFFRRAIGITRELDILSCRLGSNLKEVKTASSEKLRLRNIVRSMTNDSHKHLKKILKSVRYKKLLYDLKRAIAHVKEKKLKPENLLSRAMKEIDWKKSPSKAADYHQIRISLKNLRYSCEFWTDFYDKKKIKRMISHIVTFQNILGEYHDAKKSVKILRRMKEKSSVINELINIENDHARNACKKFEKVWRSKVVKPLST